MEYLSLTQDERDLMQAQELHGFETQHFQFALQVERETLVLEGLPKGEWPQTIAYLKGKKRDEIFTLAKSPEDAALAQQYAVRDHIQVRVAAASLEAGRVAGYHEKALAQLPVARRAAALAAAKVKRDEEEAARLGKVV